MSLSVPPPAAPPGRYGRPPGRRRRRLRAGLLAALAVGFAVVVVLLALRQAGAPVTFTVRTIEVVDDETVRVSWEVARAPGTAAECLVRARGEDGEEVGREEVPVPAADARRTVVSHDLSTSARAVTGEVRSCIAREPAQQE
jgi:hypothetical protein